MDLEQVGALVPIFFLTVRTLSQRLCISYRLKSSEVYLRTKAENKTKPFHQGVVLNKAQLGESGAFFFWLKITGRPMLRWEGVED